MANIPPPPAGFTIVPQGASNIPPPPAGFTLDQQQQTEQPSTWADVAKSAVSGIPQGVLNVVGLPGTIGDAFNNSMSDILGMEHLPASQFSGGALRRYEAAATNGASEYKPQTTIGNIAQAGTSAASGGALLGPGSLISNAAVGGASGITSEAAGQVADRYAPAVAPYARFGGAMFGPAIVNAGTSVINAGASKLASMSPTIAAAQNLREAMEQGGMKTQAEMSAALANNPRLAPMDVNPGIQQAAMKMATQPGAARTALADVVNARQATAAGAVDNALDTAMGPATDVKQYLDGIKQTAATNGKSNFDAALNGAGPVDISPVLAHIDNTVNPGVQGVVSSGTTIPMSAEDAALMQLRNQLASPTEQLTDAARLHQIQSNLRTKAETLAGSANGQDRLVAGALRDARQKIINQVDAASGGKYRPAQQQYASDMSIEKAFDKGRTILSNGGAASDAALENRPEYWADWMAHATQPEIDAARQGARTAAENMVNSVRNAAAKGRAIPEVGFNRARFDVLLGKQETDKLVQALGDESSIADTNAKLFANSMTAPRSAVNKLVEVAGDAAKHGSHFAIPALVGHEAGGLPGMAAGVGLSAAGKLAQAMIGRSNQTRNALMAKAISGDDAAFQQAISPRLAGPLIAPNTNGLTDPRALALAAALYGLRQIPRGL